MARRVAPRRRPAATNGNGQRNASTVRELTQDELLKMIDRRSRALLGISGDQFLRRYRAGKIEFAPVEGPIIVLADLLASG